MADKNFTLIELHFDGDTQFGPGSIGEALPIGSTDSTAETESETDDEAGAVEESGGNGKSAVGALIALVVLIAVAAAARKFRGGDEEPDLERDEEPDVIVN